MMHPAASDLWRGLVALSLAAAVLVPWALGVSETGTAKLMLVSLRAVGFREVRLATPTVLAVRQARYRVCFICTPTVLPLCGIALLWFGRLPPRQYLLACLGFTVAAGAIIIGNMALSVYIHQRGVDWTWAHFPGAVAGYAVSLVGCFAYAEIRQHRLRRRMVTPDVETRCGTTPAC